MPTPKCTKCTLHVSHRTPCSLPPSQTRSGYGSAKRTVLRRVSVCVSAYSGNLYTEFTSIHDYEQVRDYAQSLGVLQWESETKRMLFVTAEGHESVREFIQRRRV